MNHHARAITFGLLLAAAGCGGGTTTTGPTGPTPTDQGFLTGRWTGTITLSIAGRADTVTPTEWVLELEPNSITYTGTAVLHDAWLPVTVAIATVVLPAAPGGAAKTSGFYPSPRGCSGTFWSEGTATATELTGTIGGVDCGNAEPGTFRGSVRLTKTR